MAQKKFIFTCPTCKNNVTISERGSYISNWKNNIMFVLCVYGELDANSVVVNPCVFMHWSMKL